MAEKHKIKKKIYVLLLVLFMIFSDLPIVSYAKASAASEQNFANIVLFAHFKGDNASADAEFLLITGTK